MGSVKWTKEQLQAIETSGNNILVAAAAGSGKTAVLVERIINKIINEKINIDQILVVTFTNAAASEMRERILDAIYKKIEQDPNDLHLQKQITLLSKASICTIDSFCLDIVKSYFYEIDITPNFRIADNAELELLKMETIDEIFEEKYGEYDKDFLKVLEMYTKYQDDTPLKDLIIYIYNYIQSCPFPNKWFKEMTEKYNINNSNNTGFENTQWGKIIINEVKEKLIGCIESLNGIAKELQRFPEVKKYCDVINQDIYEIEKIININNWDNIYNCLQENIFTKWPIDKKVTIDIKNVAKEKRDNIKKQFNKAKELINCTSCQAFEDINDMYETICILAKLVEEFSTKLINNKKEKNILDFNDIEHYALDILIGKDIINDPNKHTRVALKYIDKFKEIAIDEYQDSNLVQEYILTAISNGRNIFMVGDVKQSIYKFRQARPELFIEKYEKYKTNQENEDNLGIKIQLFKNFRSRENILNTTNAIFQSIMSKELGDIEYDENEYLNLGTKFEDTKLELAARNTDIDIIETNYIQDENNEEPIQNIELEAEYVANKIKKIIDSNQVVYDKKVGYRKVTYRDIVILLRATKDRANYFEKEIIKLGMPVFSDASPEYLDSIEIQTIINLLKVIDNPMYDIPLVSVMRSQIGGFSDNDLIKIRINNDKTTFYESLINYKEDDLKEKINKFLNNIETWREKSHYQTLDELIWNIYTDTGYYNYVSLMPNGTLRQANLKSLFEKAKQYENASFKGIYNFINFIDRLKNKSSDLSAAKLVGENENVIRIMSIHKSKGLEFPIVFLCCSNKQFNIKDLNGPIILHQDLGIGANYISSESKIQFETLAKQSIKIKTKREIISEEMRLLYVALTRAKDRLIITGTGKDVEEELKEKEEILDIYQEETKINKNVIEKYKSYLDWIELVYLKDKNNIFNLSINKPKQQREEQKEETIDLKKMRNDKIDQDLKQKLEWEYKHKEATKIETKTSVSKIKSKNRNNIVTLKEPVFLRSEDIISPAQKGTVMHLCFQKLPLKKEYSIKEIGEFIEKLFENNIITDKEKQSIDLEQLHNYTKSSIWKELLNAKNVYREQPFYINITADEIYNNNIKEEILIQGVIDLYYINSNDELILVDYKTDYVEYEDELIKKYKEQLMLYKRALESALNKKVSKVCIYSTYLGKSVDIDKRQNNM